MRHYKSVSTYLDLVRFAAAVLVVLEHGVLLGVLPPMGLLTSLSHEAVVVFFVLSGLVIAASSNSPQATALDYVVNRAARIYSVALPALICCYGALLLSGAASAGTAGIPVRFASSLLFLDGVWTNYGSVPFNGPYWSLCYEAWYYAFWGVLCFARRPRVRLIAAACILVAMGPAFAALAGVWLLGALLAAKWEWIRMRLHRPAPAALLALASLLGVAALAQSNLQEDARGFLAAHIHGWWRLRGAELMATDYVIAALVAVHLAAAGAWLGDGRGLYDSRAGRAIRYCARFTFALYLFHYPLLLLFKTASIPSQPSLLGGAGVVALTVGASWAIALGTEGQLPRWRRLMRAALTFGSRFGHGLADATPTFTRG